MTSVHMIVGTLVLLAYLALTVVNLLAIGGRSFPWARALSFGAATLLLAQYVLGFGLLGDDREKTGWHYAVAFAALITVGFEHGFAMSRPTAEDRARFGALATAGTTILVLIAYIIGQSS